ncbi:MAG: hypothetical protein NT125_04490, partial [Candidatus Bipolaricaulota bacterium]|nr:hypothetical protein [Candidatus Bipolaricaulota bacterium]
YGGGDFTVSQGTLVFVCDGRLYRQSLARGGARPITPPFGQAAAPAISPDGRWVLFVWSDGVEDVIAVVDLDGRLCGSPGTTRACLGTARSSSSGRSSSPKDVSRV